METFPAIIKKQELIEKRRDDRLEQKKGLLEIPNVQWNLSENEMNLLKSNVQQPLRKISDEELVKKLKVQLKFICRDIGISYWDDPNQMKYDSARFFTTVKKYYNDFSLSEIKMAFELVSIGELDEWLPKDKNGNPDGKHYNSFNLAYYTKVLNAFKSKRSKVWSKANQHVPLIENVISEDEKKKNNKFFIDEIYESFDQYLTNQIKPNFTMAIYLQEFVDQKIIRKIPKPTKQTIDEVYRKQLLITTGKRRKKLIDEFHSNNFKGLLVNDYQIAQNNKEMKRVFDEIIKLKKHIKDYLKYRYE